MQFLSKILGGGASEFINSVSSVVDEYTLSKEEKQEFKLKMQEYILKMDEKAQETYQSELDTRADIIKAELSQGDKYTKRARPTIVYVGLIFIFVIHVLVPVIDFFSKSLTVPADFNLPPEFWWAWSTVVGIYGVGRTAEKFGMVNKFTQLTTGSGAAKAGNKTTVNPNNQNASG